MLKRDLNFTMDEIMDLECIQGRKMIKWHMDEKIDTYMSEKISFLSAHGVDIHKLVDDEGKNVYVEWQNKKKQERMDQRLKNVDMEELKKKEIPIFDKDIQKFMIDQELNKRH